MSELRLCVDMLVTLTDTGGSLAMSWFPLLTTPLPLLWEKGVDRRGDQTTPLPPQA